MRTRPTLSPGQIFTLIQRAFEQERPGECRKCKVPLPYIVPRPDEVSANWRIGTPLACDHKCDAILAEIAMDLAARYDMGDYALNDHSAHGA